jgi:hypothetical protein
MTEEIIKPIPTGLIGAALLVLGAIIIVQRFVLGLPLYDGSGTILPAVITPSVGVGLRCRADQCARAAPD